MGTGPVSSGLEDWKGGLSPFLFEELGWKVGGKVNLKLCGKKVVVEDWKP